MPTYDQLEAEQWWGREIVTPELDWLGDELCRRTGQPRSSFGTKGNNKHLRGAHRSQEWILKSKYCTSRTYTVQSGLTAVQLRHIAGVDFVPGGWGSEANERLMIAQTGRLIRAMQAGQLNEVREVFGTTNGRTVTGWNNVENRTATSDDSHLEHWHLTLDRRHCANRNLMERILAVVLGEDDDVSKENVIDGLRASQPYQSTGVGRLAADLHMGPVSERTLSEYTWADVRKMLSLQIEIAAQQTAILAAVQGADPEQILAEIRAQGDQTRAALLAQLVEMAPGLAAEVAEQLGPEVAATEVGEAMAREFAVMLARAGTPS